MAYSYDQIIKAYTTLHVGKTPDTATADSLRLTASLNASGQLSDGQVANMLVNGADSTTAVAVLTYQFFTGKSPSAAGLTYLVNSPTNTSDLNDAYYAKFNLENRYINFAANLGLYGEGATAFASKYGAMDFDSYVTSIYQSIIGRSYAEAASINVDAAISYLISTKDAVLQTVREAGLVTGASTAAQVDLAVKAAMAGLIMAASIKADVGLYAAAADNFMIALTQGNAVYNTNITQTYKPSYDTPAHGTGHAIDRSPVSLPDPVVTKPPPVIVPVSHTFTLGSGVNRITGTAQDDTFNGTDATLHAGDRLNGGNGDDVLNLNVSTFYTLPSVTVSNIETVNITNNSGYLQATDWSGWTGLQTLNVTYVDGYGIFQGIPSSTDVNITGTVGVASPYFGGGHDVYANFSMGSGDPTTNSFTVGDNSGETNIVRTNTGAGDHSTIKVYTSAGDIYVTQIADFTGLAFGDVQHTGDVNVYGSATTRYVQVEGSAPVSAGGSSIGIAAGRVSIADYQAYIGGSALGSLTSVSVDGFKSVSSSNDVRIYSNVLDTLTLAHGVGDVYIFNALFGGGGPTTLDLTVSNLDDVTLHDEGVYTTINVHTGSSSSILLDIDASALTTLVVNGLGSLALNAANTNVSAPDLHQIYVYGRASLTATFGAGNETITLGGGASVIDTGGGSDTVYVYAANATSNVTFSTLTMDAGEILRIGAQHGSAAFTGTMGAAATGITFQQYLDSAASSTTAATTSHWSHFQYAGDTYIVLDSSNASTFQAGTDIVVKLVGAFNEAGASISAGSLTIQ